MNLLALRKTNRDLQISEMELSYEIEKLVTDRVSEIREKNAALEKINKELQAFNYISSHDLQEPLRKIQTFASLIFDKESPGLSEKGREYLGKILVSSGRMRALINDLLVYSRTTFAQKVFEPTSLAQLVAEVQSDLADELEAVQGVVTLVADQDLRIIPFQFRQLLYNLISNSIKFAKPNEAPVIEIEIHQHQEAHYVFEGMRRQKPYYRISVRDNGIGFDNQYCEKIFELFQRLQHREAQLGTGIGLAIVKKIVENHEGFIRASSKIDEGTTFEIYLPELHQP